MHLDPPTMPSLLRCFSVALCATLLLFAPSFVVAEEDAAALTNESADAIALDDDALAVAEVPPQPTTLEAAAVGGDDELWFVSTRCARYSPAGSTGIAVWKYDGAGGWQTSSLDALTAAKPSIPTCFHIHGNRVSYSHSNSGGWEFYERLTDNPNRKPLRFVIFTWPSDRIGGSQRDDVRTKAAVSECHAIFLAEIIDRLPAQSSISLIGYSYGARMVAGALHQLGGGAVRGRSLTERKNPDPRQIRAVFLAGAVDSGCFLPNCNYHLGPSQLDYLLVSQNCADHVLKWYPALYHFTLRPKQSGPQAMGYVGCPTGRCLPELRVEHVDVSCLVGDIHDWHGLEHCRGRMLDRMRACVTFAPLGPEPTAVVETAAK
jgi:hypothetical protein